MILRIVGSILLGGGMLGALGGYWMARWLDKRRRRAALRDGARGNGHP